MTKDCVNPYCPDPKSGTRLPSLKEINRLHNELSSQPFQDELDKKSQFPVLDPSNCSIYQRDQLEKAFEDMAKREIRSVFEEVVLPKPNKDYSNISARDISLDKVLPDRRELDRIVFEAIGLTELEQLEVYRAVVELVKNRLVKAGSVYPLWYRLGIRRCPNELMVGESR